MEKTQPSIDEPAKNSEGVAILAIANMTIAKMAIVNRNQTLQKCFKGR